MRIHLLLSLFAIAGSAVAQPTLRIGANTRVVGSSTVRLVYGGGTLTNNGTLNVPAGSLIANGPTTYGGAGAATVASVTFRHTTGSSALNSLLSVTDRATLSANAALNANGQLYLRTDQFPNADLVNDGLLTGTVQGLVTKATVTTGATPYASQLSTNVSGSVMRYQWQSSPNNGQFTDVPGATQPTYTANVTASEYYRCLLTTSNTNYSQTTPARFLEYTGTPANQTVCRSSSVTLKAVTTGSRYEWYRNGKTVANRLTEVASAYVGTKTASLTLVNAQAGGTFYCKVFAADGSFVFDGPYMVMVDFSCTTPGARIAASAEVRIEVPLSVVLLPNPVVGGQLRAIVRGAEGQPLRAELVDLQGQVRQQQQWAGAETEQGIEWTISDRPAGLYLLRVQTPTQITTAKVIHQE